MAVRIAVTSDLHYDPQGHLTLPERCEEVASQMRSLSPDIVVLAGDLAHGLDYFDRCLQCFSDGSRPVCVLPGNHDVWRDRKLGIGSAELLDAKLEEVTTSRGARWLEGQALTMNGVAVVGTMAWYDYSAIDPHCSAPPHEIAIRKRHYNNDARWIDWPWTDPEVAARLASDFLASLHRCEQDPAIESILVVTHVPIMEEQITRKPRDPVWGFTNAYFGNLKLGGDVITVRKVRAIISGHTHVPRKARIPRNDMPAVDCRVVGSDYGRPSFEVVEI